MPIDAISNYYMKLIYERLFMTFYWRSCYRTIRDMSLKASRMNPNDRKHRANLVKQCFLSNEPKFHQRKIVKLRLLLHSNRSLLHDVMKKVDCLHSMRALLALLAALRRSRPGHIQPRPCEYLDGSRCIRRFWVDLFPFFSHRKGCTKTVSKGRSIASPDRLNQRKSNQVSNHHLDLGRMSLQGAQLWQQKCSLVSVGSR